jgi:hypothetical protein
VVSHAQAAVTDSSTLIMANASQTMRHHFRAFSSWLRKLRKVLTLTNLTKFVTLVIQVISLWDRLHNRG